MHTETTLFCLLVSLKVDDGSQPIEGLPEHDATSTAGSVVGFLMPSITACGPFNFTGTSSLPFEAINLPYEIPSDWKRCAYGGE